MNSTQLFCTHLIRRDETIRIDDIHFPFPPVVQTALTPRCCGCKSLLNIRAPVFIVHTIMCTLLPWK